MRLIKLSQGLSTMVDDKDFEALNEFKWFAQKVKNTFYAGRNMPRVNGRQKTAYMHREIMNTPAEMETDHRDRNGLNNQRENLRVAKEKRLFCKFWSGAGLCDLQMCLLSVGF